MLSKENFIYAVILAVVLALFFVMGNPRPSGSLSAYPTLFAFVAFPLVLAFQLASAAKRRSSLSFRHAFRLGESTVFYGAVLFAAIAWPLSRFYFRQPDPPLLGTFLLITIFATWLVGTVFSVLCALAVSRIARKHQAA
ncbi:MAG: hypothetical protein EHM61_19970 [Acidobacteria bacterium]|nr:MAG: hypothetical protein EHM61_19970 [Acidobacteriota bacterium]